MKRIGLSVLAAFVVALAVAGISAAGEEVTMEGSYVWVRDDGETPGDIKAVFTPEKEEGVWSVKFYFEWEDGPHVYSGMAHGSLTRGELEGNITSDGEREMKFKFSGSFEDGTFSGTHGFIDEEGEVSSSGTITLSAG